MSRRHAAERREVLPDAKFGDAIVSRVLDRRRHTISLADRLRALSPRLVLERGYALVRTADGRFVRSAAALAPGAEVTLEFASGEADATVQRAARNLAHAKVIVEGGLNVYDVLRYSHLVVTRAALEQLGTRLVGEGA